MSPLDFRHPGLYRAAPTVAYMGRYLRFDQQRPQTYIVRSARGQRIAVGEMYYDARYHGVVFRPYPDLIMTPDILADLWGFMKKGYTPRPWWQRWARELWEAWLVHLEELQVWEREIKI